MGRFFQSESSLAWSEPNFISNNGGLDTRGIGERDRGLLKFAWIDCLAAKWARATAVEIIRNLCTGRPIELPFAISILLGPMDDNGCMPKASHLCDPSECRPDRPPDKPLFLSIDNFYHIFSLFNDWNIGLYHNAFGSLVDFIFLSFFFHIWMYLLPLLCACCLSSSFYIDNIKLL